jgi:hypothetical protein
MVLFLPATHRASAYDDDQSSWISAGDNHQLTFLSNLSFFGISLMNIKVSVVMFGSNLKADLLMTHAGFQFGLESGWA